MTPAQIRKAAHLYGLAILARDIEIQFDMVTDDGLTDDHDEDAFNVVAACMRSARAELTLGGFKVGQLNTLLKCMDAAK